MNKQFIKGQKVTYFGPWNNKGVVSYTHAIVHSCGNKQMILVCEATGNEMGRHFSPRAGEPGGSGTFPRVSDSATKLHGFKLARDFKEKRISSLESYIAKSDNPYYIKSVREELSEVIADKINIIENNR